MSPDWLKVKSPDVGVKCKQSHATKVLCQSSKMPCRSSCKQTHMGTHVTCMLRWSCDQRNTLYKAHALPFYLFYYFMSQQPCRYHLKKRKLICIRHCKHTTRWCVGLLHDCKMKYLSEPKLISVAIGK